MFEKAHLDQLSKIAAQWDKAEGVIKWAELLRSAAVTPAIFELRYAGRRLVDAILVAGGQALDPNLTPEEQFDTYLREVAQFCLRAQHDAIDAVVCDISKKIVLMETSFGAARIQKTFPDYMRLKVQIEDVEGKIERSRAARKDRISIYDDIANNCIGDIIDIFRQLESCEKVLIFVREDDDCKQRFSQWTFWLGVALSSTSLAVTMLPFLR